MTQGVFIFVLNAQLYHHLHVGTLRRGSFVAAYTASYIPVRCLVVVVVVVLVCRLTELLPPQGDPDRHVAVEAEG